MKTFLKTLAIVLSAIVIVAVAAVAVALVPAHRQISSVETVIPDYAEVERAIAKVHPSDFPSDIRFINTAQQSGTLGTIAHVVVHIQWPDGKVFLIDSGMNEAEAIAFGELFEMLGSEPTEAFGPVEAQLGSAVNSVQGIAFSHLHSDHSDGVQRICAAASQAPTIFQTELQKTLHNLHTEAGQQLIESSDCKKTTLGTETIKSVPGFPGLFAIAAGGHTPGSTVFVTQLNGKTWIFAGDITNSMSDIYDNLGKGFIYSNLLVPENTETLLAWRVWLKQQDDRDSVQVLVAHDIDGYNASDLSPWN